MSDRRVVWKFPVPMQPGFTRIQMPIGATILHAAFQGEVPTIWALCDPEAQRGTRIFQYLMTGEEFTLGTELQKLPPEKASPPRRYLGTFFLGELVLHLFAMP